MSSKLLKDAGEALYGARWQREMARALGMSDRHIRRLAAGAADLSPGIATDLWRIAEERAAELDEVIKRLKAVAV